VRHETPARMRGAVGNPSWSTVVELGFSRGELGSATAIIMSPVMRALRVVRNLDGDAFAALCDSDNVLPLRSIIARASPFFERLDDTAATDLAIAIEHARGLPELRRLVLTADLHSYHPAHLRWLIASPLAGRLEYLELVGFGAEDQQWAELVPDAHPTLGELVITSGHGQTHFRRGDDGRLTR
jgi:hypothetical protein